MTRAVIPETRSAASVAAHRLCSESLIAIGWKGHPVQPDAALPALRGVGLDELRHILSGLGVTSTLRPHTPGEEARAEHLPCLAVTLSGAVRLYVPGAERAARVYDPSSAVWAEAATIDAVQLCVLRLTRPEPAGIDASATSWTAGFLRRAEPLLLLVGGLSLVMHAASIISSLLIIFIYDNVIEARALDTLLAMTAAIALLIWVEHSCRRMRTARLADFTARFDGAIAELSFRTVARSPLDSSEAHSGRIQVNRLRRLLIGRDLATLIGAVCDLPCVVLSLICLLAIAGPVCLVPVACSGALLAYHMLSAKRIVASAAQMADARAAADSQLEETILNMDALREVGAEHAWVARTGDVVGHGASRRLNHMHLNARLQSVSGAASSFASVLTLAGCALLAMDNVISSGALFTAMTIVYRMMGPVQSLAVVLPRIAQIRSGLRRLDDLARVAQRQTAAPVAARPGGVAGRIKVAGVGLRYGQNGPLVLRSVDLALVPGELVGIIGPTGSGKTSLLRVIAGQIEARVGTVTLDDTDLRQFDGFELSRIIGHVPDAPSFFSGTVLDNMRLVRPGVTADDIRSVLAGLGLSPLSPALPFGLETPLDHGGGLALGDLQLLGLARAMLVQPRVLLIDDTLSALDLDVQRLVLARLQAIKARTAVLIATSSPSLLAALDRVVVLGDGQIKDNGPPQAVLPKLLSSRSLKAA